MLFQGWYEIEFSDSSIAKDIYVKYHVGLALVLIWTVNEIGGKGIHWLIPFLVSLFGVGGIVGK